MQMEDKLRGYPTKDNTELAKRLKLAQERFNIQKSSKETGVFYMDDPPLQDNEKDQAPSGEKGWKDGRSIQRERE